MAGESKTGASTAPGLFRSASLTMVGRVVYLLSRVAIPPLVLRHVGLEEYGLWACAFVLIGYLGMGAFGVSNVYVRFVAEHHGRGELDRIDRLVSTGVILTGGVSALLLVLLWWTLPALFPLLHVPPALAGRAFAILFAACAAFLAEMSLGAFGYVLIGLRRGDLQSAVWTATSVLEAVLIAVLLGLGAGVTGLVVAFATRLAVGVVACAVLCRRLLPGLSIGPRHFDRAMLSQFLQYGGIVQVAGLLGILLYSIEKVIAGLFLGIGATALFDVGEKFAVMTSGLPGAMNGLLLAEYSRLGGPGDPRARSIYLGAVRWIAAIGGVLMAPLAAFAGPVIAAWLGAGVAMAPAALILAVFTPAFHMHVLTGPASALHRGQGEPQRELFYPLLQLALVAVSVSIGFLAFGRTIAVVATTVAGSMLASAAAYELRTNRLVGIAPRAFARRAWWPALLPYAVAFAAAWAVGAPPPGEGAGLARLDAVALLLRGGIAYLSLLGPATWLLVCDRSERAEIAGRLRGVADRLGGLARRHLRPGTRPVPDLLEPAVASAPPRTGP